MRERKRGGWELFEEGVVVAWSAGVLSVVCLG